MPGYHGDDCGTTFAPEDGEKMVPILSAGDYNLTRKSFTKEVGKNKALLVGFSSFLCHKCIVVEPEYAKAMANLSSLKVPFARANADDMKSLAAEHGASQLPALVLFRKQRPILYQGVHTAEAIVGFVKKVTANKPAVVLNSVADVESFVASRNDSGKSLSSVMVVGFFSDHQEIEEDDYDDFMQVARDLQVKEDVYFGVVTNKKTSSWFKTNKTIDRTPSVLLVGEDGKRKAINLDEFYGEKIGLSEWIVQSAVPLVGKLTHTNFRLYDKIGKPMLMLFLDLTHEDATSSVGRIVGGKSGGLLNEVLVEEFKAAAKEHSDRITFVYINGLQHEDQMRALGLYGGKERLPSIAFNTREALQIPFSEDLPINRDTILQFCADFLGGKLRSPEDAKEMAKKALLASTPINPKNKASRKAKREAPEAVKGVSEQFGDASAGDLAVQVVTAATFEEKIMVQNEFNDVLLMLHAQSCEPCAHFAVYFKKMAERFHDLQIPSLVITRMDVTNEAPPADMNLMQGTLPILVMLRANEKQPPWNFYSGLGKVQAMMKWVQQQAAIPFEMPNLPHLDAKQRELYKEQVREREEYKDKIREEEKQAIAAEDARRAKDEEESQKKKKKKQEDDAWAASSEDEGEEEEDSTYKYEF